jgi:hypothetical protein
MSIQNSHSVQLPRRVIGTSLDYPPLRGGIDHRVQFRMSINRVRIDINRVLEGGDL